MFENTQIQAAVVKHYYCSKCSLLIEEKSALCPQCKENDNDYFLEIPLVSQLESLYQRPDFYLKLKHRSDNNSFKSPGIYADIYDGDLYKELSTESTSFLSDPNNISFSWKTDGVSIFKSSKYSIWPLYLVINELPYSERYKMENVLLIGLWFGYKKPNPNVYLKPFRASMRTMYKGVELRVPHLDTKLLVKGVILCGTCDLPAKAQFLYMNLFNGKFGCQVCKQEGLRLGNIRVYPFQRNLNLRTEAETILHATQAQESGSKVCGVKGLTALSKIIPKFITSTAVDVMHAAFEGASKKMIQLWFDSKYSKKDFSISSFQPIVDKRLLNISPPSFISRRPRTIGEHLAYWKASEFKAWLFYYSLPILRDILSEQYYEHYKLLVLSIYILCTKEISVADLDFADALIIEFTSRFSDLYGTEHMSANLHQLRHLTTVVKRCGPLWTTSCFPFESLNGNLKALVHSSNGAHLQICRGLSLYASLSTMRNWCDNDSFARQYCESVLNYQDQEHENKSDSIHVIGKLQKIQNLSDQILLFFQNIGIQKLYKFRKLMYKNILYTSESCKLLKTESFYVKYSYQSEYYFGKIQYFLQACCQCTSTCDCGNKYFAVIQKLNTTNALKTKVQDKSLFFIHDIVSQSRIDIIEVYFLKCVCFHIKIDESQKNYVVEPVNLIEKE